MKRKIGLTVLALAFFTQLFFVLRTHYVQSNPVEVPSFNQTENGQELDQPADGAVENGSGIPSSDSDETIMDGELDLDDEVSFSDDLSEDEIDESSLLFEFSPNTFSSYLSINPDFTGWLSIDNTGIDYPVVKGRDNEFYLEHDFYKEAHPFGSIFMDYRNVGNGQDNHTIIYGHYTPNGHMFADLENYLSEDFFLDNNTITLHDMFAERTYEIFSVHIAPADPYFINESFRNPDMTDYMTDLQDRSVHQTDAEFNDDTRLLTLISCNYTVDDGRIYLHAIEIDE
ncbi:MAG: class B sortase [Alkalibacterium sp.]|nr:class B sortase [Alkalibacterium sp.]